jgi:hypothetical protein
MKLVERQKRERERGGEGEFAEEEEEEFEEFQTVFRESIKSREEGEEVRELSCEADSDFFLLTGKKIIKFLEYFSNGRSLMEDSLQLCVRRRRGSSSSSRKILRGDL